MRSTSFEASNRRRLIPRLCAPLLAVLALLAAEPAGAAAAGGPRFSDPVTPTVGDDPARIVATDLSGDGAPDLATVDWTSSTLSVVLGRGDGSFGKRARHRVGRHPVGIAAADLNGDGLRDLVTASNDRAGSVTVLLNSGAGRLVHTAVYHSGREAEAVAAGDVNGDGLLDLVTAHYAKQHMTVLLGVGRGRFGAAQPSPGPKATDVELADLNGDGRLDAVLAASARNAIAVRLGHGDGSFEPARQYTTGADSAPFDLTLADLNRDNRLDVAVGNYDSVSVSVFLGLGDGTYGPRRDYEMGDFTLDAVVVADFDRDGILDIAAPSFFGPALRLGRGDGTFRGERTFGGDFGSQAGAVADFNGDGWADVAFNAICDGGCSVDWVWVFLNWTGQPAPPCVVPDVSSRYFEMPLADAIDALRSRGCRLGHVRHRTSRRARKGYVISQRPRASAVLPSHGRVDLVVSLGRRR
jgi:hypothetical protein